MDVLASVSEFVRECESSHPRVQVDVDLPASVSDTYPSPSNV